jgi:hypothetical protein
MKYTTVSALCEGVAGAIRAKEESTEKINPQDFVQRIKALSIGGGGGGEEYGVYLKILEVPAKIDGGVDSTLNVDSPEVVEFFSDAFEWCKAVNLEDEFNRYQQFRIPNYFAVVAYEAKKKDMGLPNVYDTLQKRVPILAVKTKLGDTEKLLIISDITREENGELFGSNFSFHANFDEAEDSIYNMWKLTVQFRKDGILIASID